MFVTMSPCNHIFPIFKQCSKGAAGKWTAPMSRANTFHSLALSNKGEHEVAIALGSNMGDRLQNFNEALQLMKASGIHITRHGCLYETSPAHITDQPLFLNSAVRCVTELDPHELLKVLKKIEKDLGRTKGIRYGPRPIDLDILFYGKLKMNSEDLTVPHERICERSFVMAPLVDLLGLSEDTDAVSFWHSSAGCVDGIFEKWNQLGGESLIGKDGLRRVLPIRGELWEWSKRTHVMGVLNLTPDSFSDGGRFQSIDNAVSQVKLLTAEGADIIDIGAQSTRPNAPRISVDEELSRLIPILDAVMELPELDGKLLSVDTFYSEVASEALKRGVHIINDVSGGRLDPDILTVVKDHEVGYCMMHMRGDSSTMQSKENLLYKDVIKDVADELNDRISEAELSGIPAWRIIIDPGIGFSKKCEHNLEILMNSSSLRRELGRRSIAHSNSPILIGPSRKRFLGNICNRSEPLERDPATVAAVTAGILGGANIIRVHNVRNGVDAAKVSDALIKHRKEKV